MLQKPIDIEKAMVRVLSDEGVAKIHEKTLTLLENTGITVMHSGGLAMLADAGAKVDVKSQVAKIPASLVERCLSTAAKEFVMAGRDPAKDLSIKPGGRLYGRNGGGPGHVMDLDSGQVRNATLVDTADYARLVDALQYIDIVAPIYAQDTNPETRDIRVLAKLFTSTTKHINMRLLKLHSLPYVVRMAEIVAGGKENLRQRPLITLLESPIAPLKIPDILVETMVTCGEYGIPVEICSMPIAGATGPITLAGSLLMSNIEMVSAIVFSQLAHPGAPVIFTPRIMVMDMASGHAMTGSIENALLATAGVQLAREAYQLPVNMHGPYTDALLSDAQAGIENTYFTFMPALAGANILTGAGHLEGGLFVSFAQLMIDNELMGIVRRAVEKFEVNEDTLGADAIERSLTSGNLLVDDHTMKFLRKSGRYKPTLLIRQARQNWLDAGAKDMQKRAWEMAKTLLESYEPLPLDEGIARQLDEVVAEAARKLE